MRDPLEWPARSAYLTPVDFFVWGYIESKVYIRQSVTKLKLREIITETFVSITPEAFQIVRIDFVNRLFYCQEIPGQQFEHMQKCFFYA